MNHTDDFLQHITPLAAPLPAPSGVFTRRPRVDAEVIDAMAAARVTPFPSQKVVHITTPRGYESDRAHAQLMRAWHLHRVAECEAAKAHAMADLVAQQDLRLSEFGLSAPGPITMLEPQPWWRRVNWGAVAMLASATAVSGACIWSLL